MRKLEIFTKTVTSRTMILNFRKILYVSAFFAPIYADAADETIGQTQQTVIQPAAEAPTNAGSASPRPDGGQWSLGIGTVVQDSPFQGEKVNAMPIPVIGYQSKTFFIQGLRAGYHLKNIEDRHKEGTFLDGYITPRMRPGESRRKLSVDAGLSGGYQFGLNSIALNAQQDISGNSDGTELTLSYGLSIPFIKNNIFLPRVSVIWQSQKLANFLWGIDQETFEKTLVNADEFTLNPYNIDQSVINISAGLTHIYRFNEKWSTLSIAQVTALSDTITDNPAVTGNYDLSFIFSLSYTF